MTRLMKLVSCCAEAHRFVYTRALCFGAVASVLIHICHVSAWALGRWPADVLPAGTPKANAVVRVLNFNPANPQQGFVGTGTVIGIKPDPQGPGGWLCVLTADHVVGHPAGWQRRIGFGNLPAGWQYGAPIMFRGPQNPNGTWVDLAMLGAWVPNLAALPQMILPTVADHLGGGLIVAGYGLQGDPGPPFQYNAPSNSYGTYRSGRNTIEAIIPGGVTTPQKVYQNSVLQFDLDFFLNNPWPPDADDLGEAHIFSGDSGGPSFQGIDLNSDGDTDDPGEWLLVGVHSYSQRGGVNTPTEWALEGYLSSDVYLHPYLDWISDRCAAVPEPASLLTLAIGLAGLAYRHRRAV